MENLNQKRFVLASGLTALIVYFGCFLTMLIVGKTGIVKISNLLFHGMDFTNIIRMNIPIGETLSGMVFSFLFWGGIGYLIAFIYNKTK